MFHILDSGDFASSFEKNCILTNFTYVRNRSFSEGPKDSYGEFGTEKNLI